MRNKSLALILVMGFAISLLSQNEKAIKHHISGEKALNEGLYDESIKSFNKAIETDANATWSYVYRGMAYGLNKDYKMSIEDFSKAIELEPELTIVYEYRAAAYSHGVDYDKAIEDFTTAINHKPNSSSLYNNRGWCYLLTRKYEDCINDCSKAIELDSTYLLAYGSRGWAYYLLGEYDKSLNDLTIAMKIDHSSDNYEIVLDHYTKAAFAVQAGLSTAPIAMNSIESAGDYYALIIGNNKYEDPNIVNLDQPLKDASKLYDVLTNHYTFNKENVVFLKNASRGDIIESLDDLGAKVTNRDNLVIFYAGHGYWDESKESGYWLPVDAKKDKTTNWVRNSTIQGYIDDIETQHTLLIADACFAGGIFKTRKAFEDAPSSIENLYKMPSRKGITSGMLNEVPDKSVFMEYLVKRLEQNEEKYLSSMDLFTQFRTAVMNNSENAPQYGTIHNAGDEGGDFIFVRR